MAEKKIWSMDELMALTDEVQIGEVSFRNGIVEFQYCELTEKEEPKITMLPDDAPEEDKMGVYQEIGAKRVYKMLEKAHGKNPDGPVVSPEQWSNLPTTLRYAITNEILGAEQESQEDFRD